MPVDPEPQSELASRTPWFRLRRWARTLGFMILFLLGLELVSTISMNHPDDRNLAALLGEGTLPPEASGPITLCVGGPEFMTALGRDLAAARGKIMVQTLSFEADPAGKALAEAMMTSPAREKLLIIDSFSRHVINDRLLTPGSRLLDRGLRDEARETEQLVAKLRDNGVDVFFARPIGWRWYSLAIRDHKKLVVIDDEVAYLGGINFSEHNFLWHDLMLRIDDSAAALWLGQDMLQTRGGEEQIAQERFEGFDLYLGNGTPESDLLQPVADCLAGARASIFLACPYVTEPFFTLFAEARARGVEVTILTSQVNNRIFMKQSIMEASSRNGFDLRFTEGPMSHVKALLIDDEALIMGSANFDFLSYLHQPEVVAVIRDPEAIAQFRKRVVEPGMAESTSWQGSGAGFAGKLSSRAMNLAGGILGWMGK